MADLATETILAVDDLRVSYAAGRRRMEAVSGVSFEVKRGETLGVVGESGCGKSSTARAIMQMPPPTSGSVQFEGVELTRLKGERLRRVRPRLQMIFQDPRSSLNPRYSVRDLVSEGARIWPDDGPQDLDVAVDHMLRSVGLDPALLGERRSGSLSGGQCQRVSIARALLLRPSLLVCDEPVSALDVSVQAQILNLLDQLSQEFHLTMVFISHDLAVIKRISDRVMVMYLGRVCEIAPADQLFASPAHPYTRLLLDSTPELDTGMGGTPRAATEIPSTLNPPSGCRFHTRCPLATDRCRTEQPALTTRSGRSVACHYPLDTDDPEGE